MLTWYSQLSYGERAAFLLCLIAFCYVMYRCILSLVGSHSHVTWYRGIFTQPIFQILMWIGAAPLVVPAILIFLYRRRLLRTAPYVGNLRTRKFHLKHCEYQQRIGSDLLRYPLPNADSGFKLRFKPCNWCNPR